MDLLDPKYTDLERSDLEDLRSYINVARTVLDTRLSLGLTQQELGKMAGTKQSRISEIEALKGNLRFDTLDRVARALGLMVTLVPRTVADSPGNLQIDKEYREIHRAETWVMIAYQPYTIWREASTP